MPLPKYLVNILILWIIFLPFDLTLAIIITDLHIIKDTIHYFAIKSRRPSSSVFVEEEEKKEEENGSK